MKKIYLVIVVLAVSVLAVSCAKPKNTLKDSSLSQSLTNRGGVIVDQLVEIEDMGGVTFVGPDDGWFVYLSPDGRKVVDIKETGVKKELTWRKNNRDQFCQDMFDSEKEICHDVILVRFADGTYNSFDREDGEYNITDGHPNEPFTSVPGNPQGY